jgi:prepilin-type N-terminal cleavage/methylation domain-containing protein
MTPAATKAFTLIELLIVVAIIAILAAIAVPNFLEAQTRSKISRSQADMRTIATAIESYMVDYGSEPAVFRGTPIDRSYSASGAADIVAVCRSQAGGYMYSAWWGFVGRSITTPVAYLSSAPTMPWFDETVFGFWRSYGGSKDNQPYTAIRALSAANWPTGAIVSGSAPPAVNRVPIPQSWTDNVNSQGYVIYAAGADGVDGTVWGSPDFYDPSNGTISYGDLYRFGGGAEDPVKDACW